MDTNSLVGLGIDFLRIDKARVAYIHLYYERKRKSDRQATEASNRWEARKAHLVQRAIASGWDLDGTKFRETCAADYALNDHFDKWSWHERESKRCLGVIESELMMEAMLQATPQRPSPAPRQGVRSRG